MGYTKLPIFFYHRLPGHEMKISEMARTKNLGVFLVSVNLLSEWLTFWTFEDSIFSRENIVQTFFSGSIG